MPSSSRGTGTGVEPTSAGSLTLTTNPSMISVVENSWLIVRSAVSSGGSYHRIPYLLVLGFQGPGNHEYRARIYDVYLIPLRSEEIENDSNPAINTVWCSYYSTVVLLCDASAIFEGRRGQRRWVWVPFLLVRRFKSCPISNISP